MARDWTSPRGRSWSRRRWAAGRCTRSSAGTRPGGTERRDRSAWGGLSSVEVGQQLAEELDLLLDLGKIRRTGHQGPVALEILQRLPELLQLDVEHPALAEAERGVGPEPKVHVDPPEGAGEVTLARMDSSQVVEHPAENVPRGGDLQHFIRNRSPAGTEGVQEFLAVLAGDGARVEAVDQDLPLGKQALGEEVSREAHAVGAQPRSASDLAIQGGQGDRDPGPALDDVVQVAVAGIDRK